MEATEVLKLQSAEGSGSNRMTRRLAKRADNLCQNVGEEYRADKREREDHDHEWIASFVISLVIT